MKVKIKTVLKVAVSVGVPFVAGAAFAVTAPTDTASMGYELYDITVNDVLKGPIGFVGGLGAVIYSATQFAANWKPALMGIIGGSLAMNADKVTSTLGLLI